jgi:hypothetical protein
MKKLIFATVMAAGLVAPLAAQNPARIQDEQATAALKRELELVAARVSLAVESRVTPGAPYSAEAVTESNQVLADGNRISRKTVSRIYRDGEGRTRREEIDPDTGTVKSVVISDPVGHLSYSLDPATRTAFRSQVYIATPAGMSGARGGRGAAGGGGGGAFGAVEGGAGGGARGRGPAPAVVMPVEAGEVRAKAVADEKAAKAAAEGSTLNTVKPAPLPPTAVPTLGGRGAGDNSQTTREELGNQTIEGVVANGSRTTTVIPAGAIGNLQPIKIVSEQWMSNDLKVLVMTRHSDPRSGETIYKLQGIVRAEPDRSFFSPPPDYTVKDRQAKVPISQQN